MPETELVSLVVPTYNQAQYLGTCLDSIWFQDYPNLEIVVVYDCPTDGTREVLDAFQKGVECETVSYASYFNEATGEVERTHHPRYRREGRKLRVIFSEQRLGATRAYNEGFKAATGVYCTYVASDDICHPAMVSELATPLRAGRADFTYSDMFVVDDAGRILREFKVPDYSFGACFGDWYLCGVSKLYRRELHERLGFYDPAYVANDHEMYLRFALAGVRFEHVPKTLYSVRTHEGREIDVHSEESIRRLFGESCRLVRAARETARGRAEGE